MAEKQIARFNQQSDQIRSADYYAHPPQMPLIDESDPAKPGQKAKAPKAKEKKPAKQPWPKTLPEQAKAVRSVLSAAGAALGVEEVTQQFSRGKADVVRTLLDTLVSLGQARADGEKYRG